MTYDFHPENASNIEKRQSSTKVVGLDSERHSPSKSKGLSAG